MLSSYYNNVHFSWNFATVDLFCLQAFFSTQVKFHIMNTSIFKVLKENKNLI